ncbi:MAG TPA: helix-turn-helix transcriptional regulator [Terriglobales bacterium]
MSERIRQVRAELKLSQEALALRAGVTQGTISQLEKNPNQSSKHLPSIARALNVSVDWLENGTGQKERAKKVAVRPGDSVDFIAIRKVDFRISAGVSGFSVDPLDDDDGEPLFFRAKWFEVRGYSPDKLYAVKVRGQSMVPTLKDGDTVVVNTADTEPTDGETFAVNYDGEFVVKRLVRETGSWWIASDNQDSRRYPKKLCDANTFILGKVVHAQTEVI